MKFKERLVAAFSGSGKKNSAERPQRRLDASENAGSPGLVPRKLLSPMPSSHRPGTREGLADLTGTGTVSWAW